MVGNIVAAMDRWSRGGGGGEHLYNQTLYIDSIVTESKQSLAHFPFSANFSTVFSLGLARHACTIIVFLVLGVYWCVVACLVFVYISQKQRAVDADFGWIDFANLTYIPFSLMLLSVAFLIIIEGDNEC